MSLSTDDSDLFGMVPPGFERLVSVHKPRWVGKNTKWADDKVDPKQKAQRQKFILDSLEKAGEETPQGWKYSGVPSTGSGLEARFAQYLKAHNPKATPTDIAVLMRNWAQSGIVLENLRDTVEEEDQ